MRGKYLLVFLVICLFFVSGQAGCPKKGAEEEIGLGVFAGGVEGLDISFVENEPPASVLDNNEDPFYITVELKNKGEYTIPKEKIIATLSGISAELFGLSTLNAKMDYELEGKMKTDTEVLEGLTDQLSFEQAAWKSDLDVDFPTSIWVDVCYQYQTRGSSRLCLKQKPAERGTDDLCNINNAEVKIDNSGAPLQIKNVKQVASGANEIKVTFSIENKGEGEVYPPDAFTSACKKDTSILGKVKVEVSVESGIPIQCGRLDNRDSGLVKLSGKETTIVCSVDTYRVQSSAFEEPFNIKVTYFYKQGIGKDLTVKA